ncbi:MAG: cache domain-containing protein, partial [Anaerolineae bacterium]
MGFLAVSIAFVVLGERALRDSADRLLDERLVIAQMAASQIDNVLQEAIADLNRASRFADFDPNDPNLTDEKDVLGHTYGRSDTFASGIVFLDAAGRVVLAYPPGLYPTGSDLSTLPHIAAALAHQETTISAPFREPVNNRPVVAVTISISNDNHFLGLLSGLVSLEGQAVLVPLQQAAALGHTGHAVLTDEEGRVLASTFNLPFLSPGEHVSFYRRAMAGGQPVVETVPFELDLPGEPAGHSHVMAFSPLRTAPWGVAVGGDLDETFAGVNRLRFGLALLSIIVLVSIWTITLVGTRRLVQPVQNLTKAAQRIVNGDLHTP